MEINSDSCHVIRIEYGNKVKLIKLQDKIYSIGRSNKNSIVINHTKVSREHCLIVPAHENFGDEKRIYYYIVDGNSQGKNSSNGLFIDLRKWTLRHRLTTGDIVGIGTREVVLSYYIFSLREFSSLKKFLKKPQHYEWDDEKRFVRKKKYVKTKKIVLGKDFFLFD